jgi:hypothetical protein
MSAMEQYRHRRVLAARGYQSDRLESTRSGQSPRARADVQRSCLRTLDDRPPPRQGVGTTVYKTPFAPYAGLNHVLPFR